jgi:hypothetical protein
MKNLLLLFVFLSLGFPALAAQDDSLRVLLMQREQAVRDYQYYNEQNSNIWGKKSKKDLLRIIDTLKEIIRKDTKIINTLKTSTLSRVAESTVQKSRLEEQVKGDRINISNSLYELRTQLSNLQNLQKVRQRQINELQTEVNQTRQRQTTRDLLIAMAGLMILGLLLYIFNLRRKIKILTNNLRG